MSPSPHPPTSPLSFLPPITTLPLLSPTNHALILDALFEHSPALHALVLPSLTPTTENTTNPPAPFLTYNSLIQHIRTQLHALLSSTNSTTQLDAILGAHPRLGEPRPETLSAASRAEQAQLNAGGGGGKGGGKDEVARGEAEREREKLKGLNAEYERRFPGLRYVVFVNGRPRPVIMEDMRTRIDRGDIHLEREEAIKAMCEIAMDRAAKLQAR